ncbi:MAG TPA: hypothetical protein VMZ03_03300 [Chitinophagaceae bacterium]|nr:hypothetical protein [Chitinophagaceae bacterium]
MKAIMLLSLVIVIFSCSGTDSPVSKQLSGADSIAINLNASGSDSIINTIETTEITAIKKLKRFVGGKKAEEYKCGYNGNIEFYGKGALLGDFSFNYNEGCRHFIQLKDDKLSSTAMSNEAADFLKSLSEGKNVY